MCIAMVVVGVGGGWWWWWVVLKATLVLIFGQNHKTRILALTQARAEQNMGSFPYVF